MCTRTLHLAHALVRTNASIVHIYRVILDVVNGVSSTRQIRTTTLNLKGGEIRDLKYVPQDRVLMLLWRDAGE